MNPFAYQRARGVDEAVGLAAAAKFLAGGTNVLDLMKENVERPPLLLDINALPLDGVERAPDGGLLLGALARNAATAYHPLVRERYPLLTAALLAGASPQIRNMASNGGNLLQRTRCVYFYDAGVPCNKREPGSGCPAVRGIARQHAILGASDACIAVHPSDFCVALAALEAQVLVRSPRGERTIPFAQFHRLPGSEPEIDTTLGREELIVAIALPPDAEGFAPHSAYLKLRERSSYAFALVSVAAALELESGRVRRARLALGGVAHKPWRVPAAEALLEGRAADDQAFEEAAAAVLEGAVARGTGIGSNAFKIPMARRAIVRALQMAAAGTLTNTGDNLP